MATDIGRLNYIGSRGSRRYSAKSKVEEEAEHCFHQALDVARELSAKSPELRAATSLARLWQKQGKTTEARELLAPVYNWFTEGFDTADLIPPCLVWTRCYGKCTKGGIAMASLTGRVAIVTGAARGIGQEYCRAFAREGARVITADILSCEETVSKVRESGGEVVGVTTDVTSAQSTEAMAAEALERFGRIDILVNNAALYGGLTVGPFDQISEAEWDRMMEVNVKGMWLCCKAVVPTMKDQGKGKIINISSSTIWAGDPFVLHYVASKGAVFSLTRALARELAGTGINVNAVTPGHTMTEASKTILDPETFERFRRQSVKRQIIKRNEEPADVAGTVIFLASDASDFMTGQTLNVDGGRVHY